MQAADVAPPEAMREALPGQMVPPQTPEGRTDREGIRSE
jgi:hypothetical protein